MSTNKVAGEYKVYTVHLLNSNTWWFFLHSPFAEVDIPVLDTEMFQ